MKLAILLSLPLILSACAAPLFVGAGTAASGIVIAKDKTIGTSVDDATIWTKIKSGFLQSDINELFAGVDTKVTEGRVLLTGYVRDPETRVKALQIVWDVRGVKEVINEIKVDEPTTEAAVKAYALDTWITTQIKTKLLLIRNIRSINYNIETVESVVYVLGIAQDQSEADKVISVASTIPNVRKVMNYIRTKDSTE